MSVKLPFVSIIMPAYNSSLYIKEAIESVVSQSYANWELVVIDDCSKDETQSIVKEISKRDSRVKLLINEKNMGAAASRNRGLDHVQGDYVALLDSDDYWHPQMLEKMLQRAKETSADIVYCSYEIVDEYGKKLCNDFIVPEKTTFEESIIRNVISCSTALLSRKFAGTYRFPTNMYHEDIALWFTALRDGCTAFGVTEILASYRQRANSRSAGKLTSARRRWVIYRKQLAMPLFQSILAMIRYGYYGIIKYKKITN